MKILSTNSTLNTSRKYEQTNFKSNPVVQRQMNSMIKGEGRYVFQMLSGAFGLSSIIAWVNALKNEEPAKVNKQLDIYTKILTQEWNDLMFENPNRALDMAAENDSIISSIWTRGLISSGDNTPKVYPVNSLQKEMFFNKKAKWFFMDTNAEASLKTTQRYVDAFLNAEPEVRNKALKDVEARFDYFIRLAKPLKQSRESSRLFDKISNIVRLYVLTNMVKDFSNKEQKTSENPLKTTKEVKVIKSAKGLKEVKEGKKTVQEQGNANKAEDVEETTLTTAQELSSISEAEIDENMVLTNKLIIERIAAGKSVPPYVYRGHYPIIKTIFNALGAKNGIRFLDDLANTDRSQELAKYNEYGKGEYKAFSFRDFELLEDMKRMYKSSVTQEDFDKINELCETCVDIFKTNKPKDGKNNFEVKFKKDAFLSVQERLNVIADLFPIVFNAKEEELIKPYEEVETVESNKVIQELVFRFAKANKHDEEKGLHGYENTMRYLGLDEKDLQNIREVAANRGYKTTEMYVRELLKNKGCEEKLDSLSEVLNNPIFNKYMKTVHVRMRFLERFVLNKDVNQEDVGELKTKTVDAVNELEKNIYSQFKTKVTRYKAVKFDEEGKVIEIKKCPQIEVDGTLISLNSEGGFHTIF